MEYKYTGAFQIAKFSAKKIYKAYGLYRLI